MPWPTPAPDTTTGSSQRGVAIRLTSADIYSQYFERPLVLYSDVHAEGIAIAQQVMH